MSHLSTLINFIQNLCLEDEVVNNMFKEIDEMHRENAKLENQLDECDRDHLRLQIQLHNLETTASFQDTSAMKNLNQTSKKMYEDCIELKNLIKKIDFTKILQCYHMEMEVKCRKEWQPIQDCFAKTLEWHKKMEQRHIVQKYRQDEVACREAEDANRNQQKSMEKSLEQSLELINQAKERRNNLVLVLIKGSKDLNDFDSKIMKLNRYKIYIEGLRQEKFKMVNQLEQTQLQAFKPILNLNSSHNFAVAASNPITENHNLIMPKLPSFADILRSFNQTEKLKNTTSIQNTTSICVKSILHTSRQSTTAKQTKNVHFKMQLEQYQEVSQTETDSENDMRIEEPSPQTTMETNDHREQIENLHEMKDLENISNIEIVDLLTPAEYSVETVTENQKDMDSSDYTSNNKNQIDKKALIQDCIIFKAPFPIQEVLNIQYKENVADSINANCSQKATETNASDSPLTDTKEILNTTKKSFYEEFLELSSSAKASPPVTIPNNNKNEQISRLNNFEVLFDDNKDFLFCSANPNEEIKVTETSNIFSTNKTNSSEVQDFLDFDSNKGFAFDSDDNMAGNYNTGNMDFM